MVTVYASLAHTRKIGSQLNNLKNRCACGKKQTTMIFTR